MTCDVITSNTKLKYYNSLDNSVKTYIILTSVFLKGIVNTKNTELSREIGHHDPNFYYLRLPSTLDTFRKPIQISIRSGQNIQRYPLNKIRDLMDFLTYYIQIRDLSVTLLIIASTPPPTTKRKGRQSPDPLSCFRISLMLFPSSIYIR